MPTLILTLELDPTSQQFFERLRQQHFPAHLNQIPAHLTLFHQLPPEAVVTIEQVAAPRPAFPLQVTGLRSLGRGVAYTLASAPLQALHANLARTFAETLTPQDRQKFSPHIVIQNKSTPEAARTLLATLQRDFQPFTVQATGLTLWNYLNGPWQHAHFFPFRED